MIFVVIDRHTGLQVAGPFATRRRARAAADRLDLAYGAYRYTVAAHTVVLR